MTRCYVVTGGGRGVGRAIVERLLAGGHAVAVIDTDERALGWIAGHGAGARVAGVAGSAADQAVAERAADLAQSLGALAGWVNNAAVFRDAALHDAPPGEIRDLIAANFEPALVGCATAVRRLLADGAPGALVNVTSHQAQRPVRGALAYATAKAAIEGPDRPQPARLPARAAARVRGRGPVRVGLSRR